jgi:PAS domain S-box-containing protein
MHASLDTEDLFESVPDGLAILDRETGTIADINERCATLSGRPCHALRGTAPRNLAPDGWTPADRLESLFERAVDSRRTFDWRIERPDGTTVDLRCAMKQHQSDAKYAVVTVRAPGEEIPPAEADDDSPDDHGHRELLDGMNDTVFVVDRDGNFLDANAIATDRLGYEREELLSMSLADISPSEHGVDERLRQIAANETLVFESVQVTADGEEIPVEMNARRITYRGEPAVLSVARDISDRKRRTRELRTFKQAIEQTEHAVYITDTDGTIEYVNPAFETTTGYDATNAIGQTPSILSTGDHDDEYYERLWETILGGENWTEEIENERADGTTYYAEQTISPIVEDGDVLRFVAIQQEITERKEYEAELERYRQVIQNVPVGVFRNTPGLAGTFEEVNQAMVEMFDADSAADLVGLPVAECYRSPGQRELLSQKLQRQGQITEEELRLETLDGEPFWGAVTAIRHERGEDVYYDGIIQDVTEQREKARKLRLQEQRFRRLFEDHNAPMLLVDPDTGAIERANDAAVAFYGYEKSELCSMTIQEINQLSDEEIARRRDAADREEDNRFIFPHELADGTVRQVEVDSSPIHTGDQRLLFSIIHDVTEREQTREQLEHQNEQLEVLNRVVRHDIRNEMAVVISHAELLADHVDSEGNEYLDRLREHGEHVVELTATVKELMEALLDNVATHAHSVSLKRVLGTEIEKAQTSYDHAEFSIATPIPDVDVTASEMLSSVFHNVLNNAVQHNDAATPEVTVRVEESTESVEICIADNGSGVPDNQKEEIFGKGEHGIDSPGTGLGLYLVHTFVEQFGGGVWVTDRADQSTEGHDGAVFHIELPKDR